MSFRQEENLKPGLYLAKLPKKPVKSALNRKSKAVKIWPLCLFDRSEPPAPYKRPFYLPEQNGTGPSVTAIDSFLHPTHPPEPTLNRKRAFFYQAKLVTLPEAR